MTKLQGEAAGRSVTPDPTEAKREADNWPENERDLLREVAQAVRTIRYGSIVLTIHNGQLVEVSKNIRIRRKPDDKE